MRKSLLAVAVLGAFAANAMAADVTLYGKIDTGFAYTNAKKGTAKATNKFEMKSGIAGQSRWGMKGTEDLGNGYKVGFILESGFTSDDGNSAQSTQNGRLFGREASINVSGPFGTVYAGRIGGLGGGSATSPVSLWGNGSAFGTVYSNNALSKTLQSNADRMDNSLAYESPSFGGLKVYAFYSMGGDSINDTGKENSEEVERYYALGAKYANGPIVVFGVVDQMNYKNEYNYPDNDDSLAVTIGGSYDFGVAKIYATGQYFDKLKNSTQTDHLNKSVLTVTGANQIEGWALDVSANVPVWGGNFKFGVGYADAEDTKTSSNESKRYVAGLAYQYPLSKRTFLYAGGSYMHDQLETSSSKVKNKTTEVFAGLQHNF